MKNIFLLSMLTIIVSSCQFICNSFDEIFSPVRYGVKSGSITYKISSDGKETKTNYYFDEYGEVEATITEIEIKEQKVYQIDLCKDGYFYSYNKEQKEGFKKSIFDAKGVFAIDKFDSTTISHKGGKEVGSDKILGKECTIYELDVNGGHAKIWVWQNILLKKITKINQQEVVMEAVEFKETSDFPEGIFDIPADINIVDQTPKHHDDD